MGETAVAGIRPRPMTPPALDGATLPKPQAYSADVLNGVEAYSTLLPEWLHLIHRQQGPIFFQSPEVLSVWARHFADSSSERLVTVVVREGRRAILIWPLIIERGALVRTAKGAGSPVGQYDEILLDPACDARAALKSATEALVRAEKPDLILLERVRADSALRSALDNVVPLSSAEAAPFADLTPGLEKFLALRKGRISRQQRKRMRQFEQEGDAAFEVAESAEQAEAWLAEAIELKRHWLSSTGRVSRAFVRRETIECLRELARAQSGPEAWPRMVVTRLTLDGRTAAIEMGFRQADSYHLYLGAYAPEFAKLGPGNVLIEKLLGWCAQNGIRRYDMLAPRTRNKSEWQSGEVQVFDFVLPTTLRGRFYAEAVLHRLLPALRRAFYRLPDGLRSRLAGVALRNLRAASVVEHPAAGEP